MMVNQWAVQEGRYRPHRFSAEIQERIRALNRLDNWHGPVAWLADVFWIGVSVWLCYGISFALYPVALVVIGSRMRALATLLHESAHGILAANRGLNLVLGTVCSAYPILQTHYSYKKSHVATHHPKLGRPDVDPDLMFFIDQGVYRSGLTERQRWLRLVVLPAFGARTLSFVRYLVVHRLGGGASESAEDIRSDHRVKARRDRIAFGLGRPARRLRSLLAAALRHHLPDHRLVHRTGRAHTAGARPQREPLHDPQP
jgi:fatty acid desaturase